MVAVNKWQLLPITILRIFATDKASSFLTRLFIQEPVLKMPPTGFLKCSIYKQP